MDNRQHQIKQARQSPLMAIQFMSGDALLRSEEQPFLKPRRRDPISFVNRYEAKNAKKIHI
jgi:hypothetical protein